MTLCTYCDCFVGLAGAAVFRPPEQHAHDATWLATHCWGCGRSHTEVEADPRGRSSKIQGGLE